MSVNLTISFDIYDLTDLIKKMSHKDIIELIKEIDWEIDDISFTEVLYEYFTNRMIKDDEDE